MEKDLSEKNFNIILMALIAIFSICIVPIVFQNDTFYTIKVGEQIAKGGIDFMDHFSFHENLSYTYPHWLYDLITYLNYLKFGFTGIYVMTCILSAVLGITLYITNNKICKNNLIAFFVTNIIIFFMGGFICARAQLVTFILFTLTIYFIEKFLETANKKYACFLIIIPIIIANVHVAVFPFYFILYLPYIFEYLMCIFLKVDGKKEFYKIVINKNDNVKKLIIVMIICLFTGFLTPLRTLPYTYLIKTFMGETTKHIMEHQPITFMKYSEPLFFIITFIIFLMFTKIKIKLADLTMLAGTTLLIIMSQRQFSVALITGGFILSKILIDYIKLNPKMTLVSVTKVGEAVAICVISIFISLCYVNSHRSDKFIDEKSYPTMACKYIKENLDLEKVRIYNGYNYGSYMIYEGIKVSIDSRADLYDKKFNSKEDDIFLDFMDTADMNIFYEDTFRKYGITHALLKNDSSLYKFLSSIDSEKYSIIYKDDNFTLFEVNLD